MPTNELPPRHRITLAEAVSWLAWGRCFTREDFGSAVGLDDNRKQVDWQKVKLDGLEESDDAKRRKIQEDLELYEQAVAGGLDLIREFEKASGHEFSWPGEGHVPYDESGPFQKPITKALVEIWEKAAARNLSVRGTRNGINASAAERIPADMFGWKRKPPRVDLMRDCITFEEAPPEQVRSWVDVDFEKPEIKALGNLPLDAAESSDTQQAPGHDTPATEKTPSGLTPDTRRKGGQRSKQNPWLQEAISRIVGVLKEDGTTPTNPAVWNWLCENALSDHPYAFDPTIAGCDFLIADDDEDKLYFKDQEGHPKTFKRRALDPYIAKARDAAATTA